MNLKIISMALITVVIVSNIGTGVIIGLNFGIDVCYAEWVTCPTCGGSGVDYNRPFPGDEGLYYGCPTCLGTGKIWSSGGSSSGGSSSGGSSSGGSGSGGVDSSSADSQSISDLQNPVDTFQVAGIPGKNEGYGIRIWNGIKWGVGNTWNGIKWGVGKAVNGTAYILGYIIYKIENVIKDPIRGLWDIYNLFTKGPKEIFKQLIQDIIYEKYIKPYIKPYIYGNKTNEDVLRNR